VKTLGLFVAFAAVCCKISSTPFIITAWHHQHFKCYNSNGRHFNFRATFNKV